MKPLMILSLSLCVVIGLTACGNKGPLYLPDQAVAKEPVLTVKTPQKQQIEKKQ